MCFGFKLALSIWEWFSVAFLLPLGFNWIWRSNMQHLDPSLTDFNFGMLLLRFDQFFFHTIQQLMIYWIILLLTFFEFIHQLQISLLNPYSDAKNYFTIGCFYWFNEIWLSWFCVIGCCCCCLALQFLTFNVYSWYLEGSFQLIYADYLELCNKLRLSGYWVDQMWFIGSIFRHAKIQAKIVLLTIDQMSIEKVASSCNGNRS